MNELVEYMVKALVEEPSAVTVNRVEGQGVTVYEVAVAQHDLGRVIGRHGRIANALRSVVKAAASKEDRRVTIEIVS
ncbi:MAG: KH domain-containing protein [Armatimonadetes bacterium]|nr:KH domain-containing protein [Armatimonadota bacterium]